MAEEIGLSKVSNDQLLMASLLLMNIAPFNRLSDSNFEDTTMRPGTCHCHCLCHCRYSTERFTGIEFFSNLQAILNTILQIL
ncbi:hypothetical protein BCIN_01g07310 [Botrytis cinerea B05.10]|uniref:Uncharacterized protein n=2 Tax=Botryotinia fuckeliana TaxID=40559 RepID=A0A384J6I7_BOTFB|nr:hypothetical protein BCIN_01g07310 [Botrytis cinerea B05.10]ATZ46057.1 hypothetical protein BCIN_01g07310 [Botrytis cinerea B05.10]